MLAHHIRFPSRGSAGRRPDANGAMLPAPAPPAPIGAYANAGGPPQDPVTAVIRELRTSMLDIGTAVRLASRGREVYFGTDLAPPQRFAAPSETNSEDSLRAGVAQAGVARQTLGKTASSGRPKVSPGAMI